MAKGLLLRPGPGRAYLSWAENASDQINDVTAPGWIAYAVAWTSSGTQPTLGNGTLTGFYRRATDSDLALVDVKLTFGSTTNSGTGVWFFSLPFTATSASIGMSDGWTALDAAVQEYGGQTKVESISTVRGLVSAAGSISPTAPFTWGNGDSLRALAKFVPA